MPSRTMIETTMIAFPEGCRVELREMDDPQAPKPGTQGTVQFVDDAGQIHVRWDNGSGLAAIPGVDVIVRI